MSVCYIIGAGQCSNLNFSKQSGDAVICADGGLKYAEQFGIEPDWIVGDFDSLGYVPKANNVDVYPSMKDYTDSFIAVSKGLELGYNNFVLYGLLGGRPDHTYSNYELLSYLSHEGCFAVAKGDDFDVYMIKNKKHLLEKRKSGIISIFSFAEESRGVDIVGLKYEVENFTMTNKLTRGLSNEFCGKDAYISVKDGQLIVFEERKTG